MELGFSFNCDEHEPVSFETLPAGKYNVVAVASIIKNSKENNKYLEIEFQVLDGQFKGRKLWDRLNLWHPTPTTRQIAGGTLSAIGRAVGVRTINDSSQIHNRPLVVSVKIRRQEGYSDSNEIAAYYPLQPTNSSANQFPGGSPQTPAQPAQQQTNPFA